MECATMINCAVACYESPCKYLVFSHINPMFPDPRQPGHTLEMPGLLQPRRTVVAEVVQSSWNKPYCGIPRWAKKILLVFLRLADNWSSSVAVPGAGGALRQWLKHIILFDLCRCRENCISVLLQNLRGITLLPMMLSRLHYLKVAPPQPRSAQLRATAY